jgi:hypothetical protein
MAATASIWGEEMQLASKAVSQTQRSGEHSTAIL